MLTHLLLPGHTCNGKFTLLSHTRTLAAVTSDAEQDSQNAHCSARSSIIFIVYSVMDGRELLFSKRLVTLSSLNYFSVFEKKKKKNEIIRSCIL